MAVPLPQHAGPQKIELLFNRERPQVCELPSRRWKKVGYEECCSSDVIPLELPPKQQECDHHKERGSRENAIDTASIKTQQRNIYGGRVFFEKQCRYEVSRDKKENADT